MNFYWKTQGTHPRALGCCNWLESPLQSSAVFSSAEAGFIHNSTGWHNRPAQSSELMVLPTQWMLVAIADMLTCGTAPHTLPPCPYITFTSLCLQDSFIFKLKLRFSFMFWVDFADVEIKPSLTRQLLAIVWEVWNRNRRWLQFCWVLTMLWSLCSHVLTTFFGKLTVFQS